MPLTTLINAVKHWASQMFATTDAVERAQAAAEIASDWDAAEGKPGHVLNRPFYSIRDIGATLLPETSVTTNFEGSAGNRGYIAVDGPFGIVAGKTYTVVLNGVEYVQACEHDENLGDGTFVNMPFSMWYSSGNGSYTLWVQAGGTYTVSIVEGSTTYVKIPDEYMPDTVALATDLAALEARVAALEAASTS